MRKWIFMGILFVVSFLFGSENAGKTGLAFLKVGVDARAVGMGEAYVAVTGDASATYWNPAGMLNGAYSNVLFNHNQWFQGIRGEFGAISFVREKSAWGIHLRSFNISDIEVRDRPTTRPLEETSAHYLSAGVSYARRMSEKFNVGITVKYLYEKIFVESAHGWAVDAGITYRPGIKGLQVGAAIQHLGRMNQLAQERTPLPALLRAGAAYLLPFGSENMRARLAGDLVYPFAEGARFHLGTELVFLKQLSVRVGGMFGYDSHMVNFGAGIVRSSFRLDYALVPFSQDLGVTHRFSVAFRL